MLQENTLYTDQATKEALLKDKTAIANAFFINFIGTIGLFSISSTRGLMKNYLPDDAKMIVVNIGDANKDISLSVKLYHDIGGLKIDTVNKMTRLLQKMKQRAISNKNLDESLVREMVSEALYVSHRPHPVIFGIVDAFVKKQATLKQAAKAMFNAVKSRKKELLPVAQEFYGIARQYALYYGDIPDIGSVPSPAPAVVVQGVSSPAVIDPVVAKHQAVVSNGNPTPPVPTVKTMVEADFYRLLLLAKDRKEYLRVIKDRGIKEDDLNLKQKEIRAALFSKDPYSSEGAEVFSVVPDLSGFLAGFGSFMIRMQFLAEIPTAAIVYQIEKKQTVHEVGEVIKEHLKFIKHTIKNSYTYSGVVYNRIYKKLDILLANRIKAAVSFEGLEDAFIDKAYVSGIMDAAFPRNNYNLLSVGLSSFTSRVGQLTPQEEMKIAIAAYYLDGNHAAKNTFLGHVKKLYPNQSTTLEINYYTSVDYVYPFDNLFPGSKQIIESLQAHKPSNIIKFEQFNTSAVAISELMKSTIGITALNKLIPDVGAIQKEIDSAFDDYIKKTKAEDLVVRACSFHQAANTMRSNYPDRNDLILMLRGISEKLTDGAEGIYINKYDPNINLVNSNYRDNLNAAPKVKEMVKRVIVRYLADHDEEFVSFMISAVMTSSYYYKTEQLTEVIKLAVSSGVSPEKVGAILISQTKDSNHLLTMLKYYPTAYDNLDPDQWISMIESIDTYSRPKIYSQSYKRVFPRFNADQAAIMFKIVTNASNMYHILTGKERDFAKEDATNAIKQLFTKLTETDKVSMKNALEAAIFTINYGVVRLQSYGKMLVLRIISTDAENKQYMDNLDEANLRALLRTYPAENIPLIGEAKAVTIFKAMKLSIEQETSLIENIIDSGTKSIELIKVALEASHDSKIYVRTKLAQRREYEHIQYRAFEKLAELSASEGELYFKQLSLDRRKGLIGYLINERFMEEALSEVIGDGVPIKPLGNVSSDRLVQILKYNDIQTPRRPVVKENTTYGQVMGQNLKAPPIKKLHIDKIDADLIALEKMSVEYDKFNKYAHGEIALFIEEAFTVSVPVQEEGHAEWLEKMKTEGLDPRIMNGVFHGTGSIGASMILRYGFKVIKANDASVVGRMLGDGIYFSNVLDKVAQYIGDEGYSRKAGTIGYIFEMTVSVGKHRRDFRCAGTGWREDERGTVSPEWAVFDPNRQCKIYKAFKVRLITKDDMNALKDKHQVAPTNEAKLTSFGKYLNEGEAGMAHCLNYVFVDGSIPISEIETVDFKDIENSMKFGKNVKLDWSGMGPTISIYNKTRSDTKIIRYTRAFQKDAVHKEDFAEFLKLLKKK